MTHVARTCSAVEGPPWFYEERLDTMNVWLQIGSVWSKGVQGGEWDVSVPFSHIVAIFDVQPTLGGKHDAENNVAQAIKTQWKSPVGPRYSWVFSHSCEMWIKL